VEVGLQSERGEEIFKGKKAKSANEGELNSEGRGYLY
jgi:hypothetical protein